MTRRGPATCDSCHEEIAWGITPVNARMPLDPQPDPGGNVAAYRDGTGRLRCRVLRAGEQPLRYERRYMPHFATCPARKTRQEGHASD